MRPHDIHSQLSSPTINVVTWYTENHIYEELSLSSPFDWDLNRDNPTIQNQDDIVYATIWAPTAFLFFSFFFKLAITTQTSNLVVATRTTFQLCYRTLVFANGWHSVQLGHTWGWNISLLSWEKHLTAEDFSLSIWKTKPVPSLYFR